VIWLSKNLNGLYNRSLLSLIPVSGKGQRITPAAVIGTVTPEKKIFNSKKSM
jgi:hypothetical protein